MAGELDKIIDPTTHIPNMNAINIQRPRPIPVGTAPYLLVKATKRVLPFDAGFAARSDLVTPCYNLEGSLDPNDWVKDDVMSERKRLIEAERNDARNARVDRMVENVNKPLKAVAPSQEERTPPKPRPAKKVVAPAVVEAVEAPKVQREVSAGDVLEDMLEGL